MDVTSIGSAAVMKNYGLTEGQTADGGFLEMISQLVNGVQGDDILQNVIEGGGASEGTNDMTAVFMQLLSSVRSENVNGIDDENNSEIAKLLSQLAASQNGSAAFMSAVQNNDGEGSENLQQAILNAVSDNVSGAAVNDLIGNGSVDLQQVMLNALSENSDDFSFGGLESGDVFSKLLSGLTDFGSSENGEIPTLSGISLQSVYSLLKAKLSSEKSESEIPSELQKLAEEGRFEISKDESSSAELGLIKDYGLENSVKQAKRTLEQDSAFDLAEQSVKADYSTIEATAVKTDGTVEENAVFNQTLDSIQRAFKEQAEIYTAKLHPEGLGEIVIKMAKDESGIVLSIMADNEKTAQLINSQLAGLQSSLKEYNAQINPAVVTQPTEAFEYSGLGYDQQRGFGGGYERGENSSGGDNSDEAEEQTSAQYRSGTIDTYI